MIRFVLKTLIQRVVFGDWCLYRLTRVDLQCDCANRARDRAAGVAVQLRCVSGVVDERLARRRVGFCSTDVGVDRAYACPMPADTAHIATLAAIAAVFKRYSTFMVLSLDVTV